MVIVEGWIFDLYPGDKEEMIVWVKTREGKSIRLEDHWQNSIFVASNDHRDLEYLVTREEIQQFVSNTRFTLRREKVTDYDEKSMVLEIVLKRADDAERLAEVIESIGYFGLYRLYNVDIMPVQKYLFERDLFTLAYVRAESTGKSILWTIMDSVESECYSLPPLTSVEVRVRVMKKESAIPRFTDTIECITIFCFGGEVEKIDSGDESDKLLQFVKVVKERDPDLLFFEDGDEFTTHYLVERAQINGVLEEIVLGRDVTPLKPIPNRGTSYFAYGKILHSPSSHQLHGRINLDLGNYFVFEEAGLDGLFEIVRLTRMPIHKASRASIGKCLSSMQFYLAHKESLIVPWKPTMVEFPKTGLELLIGDRGGFIFEPRMGVYENVAEIDFSSLYATVMLKKNISAETIHCSCCPQSMSRVPEVGYNICEKRQGIVPKSLELPIKKRANYKKLAKETSDPAHSKIYKSRADALKGILVCSFGYLSYRNAKFGLIDSHMAVCAFARAILLNSVRIAERRGFKVLHGIVDSLWVTKTNARHEDFIDLHKEIEKEIDFPVSFEGVYRWIAFLPSRLHISIPVINRYFGVFEDGTLKARGIEVRRSDTIPIVASCQSEILVEMSHASSAGEVRAMLSKALKILTRYNELIQSGRAPIADLLVRNRLSKNYSDYKSNQAQAIAIRQLAEEKLELLAGQICEYIYTNVHSKHPEMRVKAKQLIDEGTSYDKRRYSRLLARAASSILQPFGLSEERIVEFLSSSMVQQNLPANPDSI